MKLYHFATGIYAVLFCCISLIAFGQDQDPQEVDHSYKPLTVKLDESGNKYIRFITWHQIWAEDGNLNNDVDDQGLTMRIRRSRLLAYAQISPRFLILTHFGLNTLNSRNMDPIGDARANNTSQLFLHAAWTEFKVSSGDELYLGAGLHYWNGLSRFTSASTLNFMTLDNYRQAWASLGLSDQFARHIGVYAKGKIGKLRYTLAVNDPIFNALGSSDTPAQGAITYSGRRLLGDDAGLLTAAYVDYQFLDQESNKLPYRVGTYLGKKRVFNIGAGFINHGNGTAVLENNGTVTGSDVSHFALDAYYDAPAGDGAINAYAVYYNFDYGDNYALGTTYGTGSSVYGQFGYLFPEFTDRGRLMPYIAYSTRDFEAFENAGNTFQFGANWFINGHHAKITLEYASTLVNHTGPEPDRVNRFTLQTHIFL